MSNLPKFDQLTPDAIKLIQQVCCFRRDYDLQNKFELIGLLKSWNASEDTIGTGVGLFEDCQLNSSTMDGKNKWLNNFERQISCAQELLIHRQESPKNAPPEIVDAAIAYVIVQMKEIIKRRPVENGLIVPFHSSQTGIICELFHDLESVFSKSNHWSHLKACFDQLLPNGVPETYLSDNDRMIFEIQVHKNLELTDRDVSWIKEDIIRGAQSWGFETAQNDLVLLIAPRYQDEKLLQLWLTREHNRRQDLWSQDLWNFSVSKTRYSSQNWERETLDLTRFDQLMIYLRKRENLLENELKSSPLT